MKIEQLIVQQLYNNKKVTLQGIGTFTLNPDVVLPAETDKDFVMPENAFGYEYNLKAPEDQALIDFIVAQTKKMKALATSDLESYVVLAKQFLNIGKPFLIEGVGTVQKNQHGEYEFTPGQFITPRIDDIPKQLREKRDETISFESEARPNNSRRNLIIAIGILTLVLAGLGIYHLVSSKSTNNSKKTEPVAAIQPLVDTTKKDTVKPVIADSISHQPAAIVKNEPAAIIKKDGNAFNIVLREYNSLGAAQKAFSRFSQFGKDFILITKDSVKYKLAIPFKRPLADTTKAKDSLRNYYTGNPYVEIP